jgi:hypothetical protein
MDMVIKIHKSWCDSAMQGPVHASLEKVSGPKGRGSRA